jgi:prepilin-type N-terminal cleavage/methylation domain-containing protein
MAICGWRIGRGNMRIRDRRRQQRNSTELGFTLLEVLVSLIIVGISFGVVFQALSQSKRISWKADEMLTASRIAHNLLVDSILLNTAVNNREVAGEVEGEDGWKFTLTAKPLVMEEDKGTPPIEIPSLFEMRLCLSYEKTGQGRQICLTRWYRQ